MFYLIYGHAFIYRSALSALFKQLPIHFTFIMSSCDRNVLEIWTHHMHERISTAMVSVISIWYIPDMWK